MGLHRILRKHLIPLLFLCSSAWGAPGEILFVFDLDDTLIRYIRPPETEQGLILPKVGQINGSRYRVLDGTLEMIQSLAEIPNAKIAFFSAGPKERNLELLELLKLPNGKSALSVAQQVLSREDLRTVENEGAALKNGPRFPQFEGPEKKDLTQVKPGEFTLDQVILIDDKLSFAPPGQERNVAWIGNKPEMHQNFLGQGDQTPTEFLRDRNKLARMRGLIDRALDLSKKEKIPLPDALFQLQWTRDPVTGALRYNEGLWTDLGLYRKGASYFHRISPGYHFTSTQPKAWVDWCARRFAALQVP